MGKGDRREAVVKEKRCDIMLKLTELKDVDIPKLMAIYAEGNRENAECFYPELPLAEGIAREEQKFVNMLRTDFFPKPENALYILEVEDQWVAALRLTRLDGFYYLEALETKPDQRKKGYGKALLDALCKELAAQGPVLIRDCVAKRNEASLRTHLSAGFVIDQDPGIEYPGKEADARCYGMLFRG